MSAGGTISFHDGRGLIIDPIYVAAMFADLQTFLPGLTGRNMGARRGAGGWAASPHWRPTLRHCLNLHGDIYRPALPADDAGHAGRRAGRDRLSAGQRPLHHLTG